MEGQDFDFDEVFDFDRPSSSGRRRERGGVVEVSVRGGGGGASTRGFDGGKGEWSYSHYGHGGRGMMRGMRGMQRELGLGEVYLRNRVLGGGRR